MTAIHPTAIIDPSARVAATARVGAYCIVGPEVAIGTGTILHNHVTVQCLTTIGCDNEIYPFSVIGADPQDRKFRGERTTLIIGDRNKIREHVTIHRGTGNGGGLTRIGSDNLLMAASHIAHDCVVEDRVVISNQVMLAGHVRVETGATIGGGAGVHHFATVGACSFVGGLARITKDVPPFMVVEGNPAEVRAFNKIAMERLRYDEAHIAAVKDAHKRLFRENGAKGAHTSFTGSGGALPMAEKLAELRRDYPAVQAISALCDALEAASEGVHGRARETLRPDDKRTLRPAPVVTAQQPRHVSH